MSILIKGMEMPEFGEKIIILTSTGYVEDVSGQVIGGVEAVSVPSHGRLIDADALLNELQKLFDRREEDARFTGNRGTQVTWNDAIYHFKVAPTIIPAEEATHNDE